MAKPGLTQERELYLELASHLEHRRPMAVATIVRAWGSTPREVGAKMLIEPDGEIRGTVGGGCGEAEVWEEARALHQDGLPRQVHVDLTEELESDSGKVCGGRFDVFVDLWRHDRQETLELAGFVAQHLERGDSLAILTVLGPTSVPFWKEGGEGAPSVYDPASEPLVGLRLAVLESGRMSGSVRAGRVDTELLNRALEALARGEDRVVTVAMDEVPYDVFIEVLQQAPELVIAGAGHIARPLCAMASLCGFSVKVLDDRPEYADRAYFPAASQVVCQPFDQAFRELPITPNTHVVLVTRGHRHDEDCLRAIAGKPAAYIGMIGSRRRTRAVFVDLEAEVPAEWLDRVYAPIGIDIGAETPEEIAVCILAEMICLRRGGSAPSLSLRRKK
ncbi:MAG: XdhC family protein [Armatimonadetes bacterium]|nr:XdhC family protein [Armatimonadota bacterium]